MLTVAYDGTAYCGWQLQKESPTIEKALNHAILRVTGETLQVIGASRTDAGVHALGNIAVFDTASRIPGEKFSYALNRQLPEDIRVIRSQECASDFHPRHCSTRKTYEYHIDHAEIPDPTRRLYSYFTYRELDIAAMQKAASCLVGEHDFQSFCSAGGTALTTVRTLYLAEVEERGREITLRVQGNGFLYNMVRIIAGTLLEVGTGRTRPEEIPAVLEKCDRKAAGPTAPPQGLFLVRIEIPEQAKNEAKNDSGAYKNDLDTAPVISYNH